MQSAAKLRSRSILMFQALSISGRCRNVSIMLISTMRKPIRFTVCTVVRRVSITSPMSIIYISILLS